MNFYRHHVLPRLIDVAMRNKVVEAYRGRLVPEARGTVLEIGIGSGLNLPFYGAGVTRLLGLDPSSRLLRMAARNAAARSIPLDLLLGSAEAIPLPEHCVDSVVATWCLCSIPDVRHALAEMRRVLVPGGQLLFVEHGLSPEAAVAGWQRRLTPLWKHVGGGCHLDRRMDELIREAGFRLQGLETGYAQGPKVMTYMYRGKALAPD